MKSRKDSLFINKTNAGLPVAYYTGSWRSCINHKLIAMVDEERYGAQCQLMLNTKHGPGYPTRQTSSTRSGAVKFPLSDLLAGKLESSPTSTLGYLT